MNTLVFRIFVSFHESASVSGSLFDDADFGTVAHVTIGTPSPVHVSTLLALPVIGGKQPLFDGIIENGDK